MDFGTSALAIIIGISIGMAFTDYLRLPSGKTLPKEIAQLAAKDERDRIIAVIREHISYAVKVEDQMDGTDDVLEAEDIVALIRGEE